MHFIHFGYSIWYSYQLPCAIWQIRNGYFRIKVKFNAGCAEQGNTMSTNDKRCSSRIHPYTLILPGGHLHEYESGIPNARVVQAAEGWDWITGQSLRPMMRIQNRAYIACILACLGLSTLPPIVSVVGIVEGRMQKQAMILMFGLCHYYWERGSDMYRPGSAEAT